MGSLKTLDIHLSQSHRSRLEDSPKTQAELDVPRYALEALQREGLVRMRTRVTGALGIQYWYGADQVEKPLRDCALMSFDELPNDPV